MRLFRWLLALWMALLRAARPQRAVRDSSQPWAICRGCRAALDVVCRYDDASYCRACHEEVSADSDSSAFSG